jgi:hypothetical protein
MPTRSERAVDSSSAEPAIIDTSKANRARFTEPRFITFPLSCEEQKWQNSLSELLADALAIWAVLFSINDCYFVSKRG